MIRLENAIITSCMYKYYNLVISTYIDELYMMWLFIFDSKVEFVYQILKRTVEHCKVDLRKY